MEPLRYRGTLKKWNAERGFGFIVADDGGQEVFVHISAFPRDGLLPAEGEVLSFEVQPDRSGKRSAVRVHRQTSVAAKVPHERATAFRNRPSSHKRSGVKGKLISLLLVAALGMYAFKHQQNAITNMDGDALAPTPISVPLVSQEPPLGFNCDGRKYCSQMTSCGEAKMFLKHCSGMEMDGNHDGVPCEQQWCK